MEIQNFYLVNILNKLIVYRIFKTLMTQIVSCNKLNIMNLKLKFLLINDCKMFRSYNTYDFKVLFYLKTTAAEHREHKLFF